MTSNYRDGSSGMQRGGPRRGRPRYFSRRKVCGFCVNHATHIDYKDLVTLQRYLSDQFKIESRRKTGTCSKHQRGLAGAVQRARYLALLPYDRDHRLPGGRSVIPVPPLPKPVPEVASSEDVPSSEVATKENEVSEASSAPTEEASSQVENS